MVKLRPDEHWKKDFDKSMFGKQPDLWQDDIDRAEREDRYIFWTVAGLAAVIITGFIYLIAQY